MKALRSNKNRILSLSLLTVFLFNVSSSHAQTMYASEQRKQAALGHYARARTLLVEALAEFEEAKKQGRPDMLVDPEEWRLSVISRTEELNRILDPRPKVTRAGVTFRANRLLIRREKDRTPVVADGAQDNNSGGERPLRSVAKNVEKTENANQARARLESESQGQVNIVKESAIPASEIKKAEEAISLPETVAQPEEKIEQQVDVAKEEVSNVKKESADEVDKIIQNNLPDSTAKMENKVEADAIKVEKKVVEAEEIVIPKGEPENTKAVAVEEQATPKPVVEDEEEVVARSRSNVDSEKNDDAIVKAIKERLKEQGTNPEGEKPAASADDEQPED
ncbi:MAG: hypothetical protein KBC84_06290 [Proteobacteria bacterium]|nr:hypothetical protein [Pseudomonadota bacterium]